MHRLAIASLLAVGVLAASPARADFSIRGGLEAPIATHQKDAGWTSIGDTLQPALNILVGTSPIPTLSLDAEFRYGFASTGSQTIGGTTISYPRTGTSIGPGITFATPVFPLFFRASLPIHLEPSPVRLDLRGAAGINIGIPALPISIYFEGAVDFPLVSGDSGGRSVDPFSFQQISVGAGVWFRI